MSELQTAEEVRRFVVTRGWIGADDIVDISEFSGGVSSQVWRIETTRGCWVLKQALAKLKVQAEWYSDVARIEREQIAMLAVSPLLEAGEVPKIVRQDPDAYAYLMTCAPEESVTWKSELMQGTYDPETAAAVGSLLRRLHRGSERIPERYAKTLEDATFFQELRVDPFHRVLADKYPELRAAIERLMLEVTGSGSCFVHGDFSPKNILVAPDRRVVLLDFEVGHWGNPVFDVAFCLGHLLLKGIVFAREADALRLAEAFLNAYGEPPPGLMAHLGLMLLARVDGKSPVEYLTEEGAKTRVRELAKRWLTGPDDRRALCRIAVGLGVEGYDGKD